MLLERNLRMYPLLVGGRNALFWLPVHLLWFSALLDPAEVLRLEALYYLGVVILEVPSGFVSDRYGRRNTLLAGSICWSAGSATIACAGGFEALAVGQLLLAAGQAFHSGSDSSLHYDSLVALERTDEMAVREARAQTLGFRVLAVSALIGGLSAAVDLRLGHALSAVAGLVSVYAASRMTEPPRLRGLPVLDQLRAVLGALRDPVVRWLTLFVVLLTVSEHVPYELVQPWIAEIASSLDRPGFAAGPAALGAVTAAVMAIASLASPYAPRLVARWGPKPTLLGAWLGMVGVTAAMVVVDIVMLPILLLRQVPDAIVSSTLASEIHPRLGPEIRATFLSAQSLAGRLGFATALWLGSLSIDTAEGWTVPAMQTLLVQATAFGVAALVLLALLPARSLGR
jgi:MFS family permease